MKILISLFIVVVLTSCLKKEGEEFKPLKFHCETPLLGFPIYSAECCDYHGFGWYSFGTNLSDDTVLYRDVTNDLHSNIALEYTIALPNTYNLSRTRISAPSEVKCRYLAFDRDHLIITIDTTYSYNPKMIIKVDDISQILLKDTSFTLQNCDRISVHYP